MNERPWEERMAELGGGARTEELAEASVRTLFLGLGRHTERGYPAWAAEDFLRMCRELGAPAEPTCGALANWAYEQVRNEDASEQWLEQVYGMLHRLLIDPFVFAAANTGNM